MARAPVSTPSSAPAETEQDDLFDFEELIDTAQQAVERLELPDEEATDGAPAPRPRKGRASPLEVASNLVELTRRQRGSFGPLLVTAVGLLSLFNLALVIVSWQIGTVERTVLDMGHRVIESASGQRGQPPPAPPVESAAVQPAPPAPTAPEGRATLERATADFQAGRFGHARAALFGLLAITDRLPPGERADVEARANFLIADSYRLQAEAGAARREVQR